MTSIYRLSLAPTRFNHPAWISSSVAQKNHPKKLETETGWAASSCRDLHLVAGVMILHQPTDKTRLPMKSKVHHDFERILLMEEILHQLTGSPSHYLHVCCTSRWLAGFLPSTVSWCKKVFVLEYLFGRKKTCPLHHEYLCWITLVFTILFRNLSIKNLGIFTSHGNCTPSCASRSSQRTVNASC